MDDVHDSKPSPDPTTATTAQLLRIAASERDFTIGKIEAINERLRGMDEATKVLNDTIHRVPTELQSAIKQLDSLMVERFIAADSAHSHIIDVTSEKFNSVQKQFTERDERSVRESTANTVAVNAAFAAQKEAAAEQNKANTLSIDKSERATGESISKLGDVVQASVKALADKIDDNKARIAAQDTILVGVISRSAGGRESIAERRSSNVALYAAATVGVTVVMAVIAVLSYVAAHK